LGNLKLVSLIVFIISYLFIGCCLLLAAKIV
jgi:hypothetical protein